MKQKALTDKDLQNMSPKKLKKLFGQLARENGAGKHSKQKTKPLDYDAKKKKAKRKSKQSRIANRGK